MDVLERGRHYASRKRTRVLPRRSQLPMPVRVTFFLFVFSFPFEAFDLGVMTGFLSLSKISGILFFGVCLIYRKICFVRPPKAMFWFFGYLVVFILLGMFEKEQHFPLLISKVLTQVQLILFFWVASSILKDEKVAREALLGFSLATVISAFAMIFGFSQAQVGHSVRLTTMGFNPNDISAIFSIGILILIGLALEKKPKSIPMKLFYLILMVPLLVGIVSTQSRAAIAALCLGVAFYPLPYRSSRRKLSTFLWAMIAGLLVVSMIITDPQVASRFDQTISEGHSSGRDRIYSAALDMIWERPFLGWGPKEFLFTLGGRLGVESKGPHSFILFLLLEVGLVGASFFLCGLFLCARAAWKARLGNWGMLSMATGTSILVENLFHSHMTRKPVWLVLALTIAFASAAKRKRAKLTKEDAFIPAS